MTSIDQDEYEGIVRGLLSKNPKTIMCYKASFEYACETRNESLASSLADAIDDDDYCYVLAENYNLSGLSKKLEKRMKRNNRVLLIEYVVENGYASESDEENNCESDTHFEIVISDDYCDNDFVQIGTSMVLKESLENFHIVLWRNNRKRNYIPRRVLWIQNEVHPDPFMKLDTRRPRNT
jgi:hypothetical protein